MNRTRLALLPATVAGLVASGAAAAQATPVEDPVVAPLVAPAATAPDRPLRNGPSLSDARHTDLLAVPDDALAAYQRATETVRAALPGCHLEMPLLAAIGKVESAHGHYQGRRWTSRPWLSDTDGGTVDRTSARDVPVGPMQLLPSTWQENAADGDDDGYRNPRDLDDAALALGVTLCADDADLGDYGQQLDALRGLNSRVFYVRMVQAYRAAYAAPLPTPDVDITTVGPPPPPPEEATPSPTPTPTPKPSATPKPSDPPPVTAPEPTRSSEIEGLTNLLHAPPMTRQRPPAAR